MQDGFHIQHTCSAVERVGNWQSVLELSLTSCVTFIRHLNYCVVLQCPCLNCEGEEKVVQEGCFPDENLMISKARPKALRFRSPHLLLLSHSHFWDHFSKMFKTQQCLSYSWPWKWALHSWTDTYEPREHTDASFNLPGLAQTRFFFVLASTLPEF